MDLWTLIPAYLLGSIPVGVWVSRAAGVDIRRVGSGNPGFTNVYRSVGKLPGLIVLAGDIGKGALAVAIARRAGAGEAVLVLAGLAAVAGHVWSLFLRFRGGKGVATAAGVILCLLPLEAFVCLLLFAAVVGWSGYVSLGSISAAAALPVVTAAVALLRGDYPSLPYLLLTLLVAAVILLRHRSNITRLREGRENRFSLRRGNGR